jgi:hypothetical protein
MLNVSLNQSGSVLNPPVFREVVIMTPAQLGEYSINVYDLMAVNNTMFKGEFGAAVVPPKDDFMRAYLRPWDTTDEINKYLAVNEGNLGCIVDNVQLNGEGELVGRVIPYGVHANKLIKAFNGSKPGRPKFKVYPRLKWDNGWKFVTFDVGYA